MFFDFNYITQEVKEDKTGPRKRLLKKICLSMGARQKSIFPFDPKFFSSSNSSISGFSCFKDIYIYICKKNLDTIAMSANSSGGGVQR